MSCLQKLISWAQSSAPGFNYIIRGVRQNLPKICEREKYCLLNCTAHQYSSNFTRRMSCVRDDRPIIGIVQNFAPNLADLLKNLRPDLRLEFNLSGRNTWSDEDIKKLKKADVIIGDPFVIDKYVQDLPNLRWLMSIWDGVDQLIRNLDKNKPLPEYTLTRNGGFYGGQMAEFVIGQIIAYERSFQKIWDNQKTHTWKQYAYRNISGRSLGIIGLGDIGKEVAKLAKPFGITVWGVVRNMPENGQNCSDVDHYRLYSQLPEMLSSCDYIVSILPSTPATDGLLDGNVLEPCKEKKSVFINIGRGNCIKNQTVLHALQEGWLRHAILDVMEEEPLTESSPLWDHPNLAITPHLSGLCVDESFFLEKFLEKYDRYIKGEPLKYVVDWQKGY